PPTLERAEEVADADVIGENRRQQVIEEQVDPLALVTADRDLSLPERLGVDVLEGSPKAVVESVSVLVVAVRLREYVVPNQVARKKRNAASVQCLEDHLGVIAIF